MKKVLVVIFIVLCIGSIQAYIGGYFSEDQKEELSKIHQMQLESKHEEARLELDKFLTKHPFNKDAYSELAVAEVALGNLERAKTLIITSRTLMWSPRVQEAEYKNWYYARDVLIIALTCQLLYVIIYSLGFYRGK